MSIKGALHLQKSHANILCTPWFPKVFHLFETKNKRTIEMKVLMAGDFYRPETAWRHIVRCRFSINEGFHFSKVFSFFPLKRQKTKIHHGICLLPLVSLSKTKGYGQNIVHSLVHIITTWKANFKKGIKSLWLSDEIWLRSLYTILCTMFHRNGLYRADFLFTLIC